MIEMIKDIHRFTGQIFRLASKAFVVLILGSSLFGCEKMLEAYVGLPLQPENVNGEYEPGLNVFGLLKAGSIMDTLNHYFEVHYIPHVFDTMSNISIEDAQITLENDFQTFELEHAGDGIYFNRGIVPVPGQAWNYTCTHDTFIVSSITIVPNMPVVEESSIGISNKSLNFLVNYDTSVYMYDVYYVDETSFVRKRLVPAPGQDTEIQLDIAYNGSSEFNLLYVIAYDKQYEQYVTTSNIFFKPNAFRPRYTTVDGGYGCIGSLSSLEIDLTQFQ